jgi:hypothetical protein
MEVLFSLFLLLIPVVLCQTADGYVPRGQAVLSGLSAASTFTAYGVNGAGKLLRFTAAEGRWVEAPATAEPTTDVATQVSCSGDVWVLDNKGALRRQLEGVGPWTAFSAPSPWAAFAVGTGTDVWALDAAGKPFFFKDGAWTAADAELARVAVGCDGAVWGITKANNLWQRQADGKWGEVAQGVKDVAVSVDMFVVDAESNLFKWIPASGAAARRVSDMTNMNKKVLAVSVAKDGALWVLDVNGSPQLHTGLIAEAELSLAERAALEAKQGGRWEAQPDGDSLGPRSVACRGDGDLWKVGADGVVKFKVAGDNGVWTDVAAPQGLSQIAVGCDGATVWAVTGEAFEWKTYRYRGKGQWNLETEKLTRVAVGSGARQVWGINVNGQLVYLNPDSSAFEVQQGNGFVDVAAGCHGGLLVVTAEGKLFQRSVRNTHLRYRGDDVKRVAVGGNGRVYLLDSRNFLFRYRRPQDGFHEGKANWSAQHKQLIDLAVDSRGNLAGVSVSGQVIRFFPTLVDPAEYGWRTVGGSLDSICMGGASSVYGLDKGVVLRYTAAKTWAVVLGVTLKSIACGCDGVVYGMKAPGVVYRYKSADIGWERIPNSFMIASLAAGKPGELWGLSHSGEPMRYDPSTSEWQAFKGDLAQLSVSCEGELWGVDGLGNVWQQDEQSGNWAKMGTGAKQVATGRGVYVVGTKDTLFKYDVERKRDRWVELGPLKEVAAGEDGAVWGISRAGRVVVISEGSTIAPGPEIPPTPVTDATAALPPPEPDMASLSTFQPGQEPELGAMDDLTRNLAARRKLGFNTFREGDDIEDKSDPEPYRPNGQDPDNPDPRAANAVPPKFQTDPRDPASDDKSKFLPTFITSPIDNSNPEPGTGLANK